MAFWGTILLSATVAFVASAFAVVVVFFSTALLSQYYPREKEAIRRKAADLLQARSDLKEDKSEFLSSLRWRSPVNHFFLAMPKIFGIVFVMVFAACLISAEGRTLDTMKLPTVV
jgi:hypothetical protein